MKEKLIKLLNAKEEQRSKLNTALIENDNKEERAEIGATLDALSKEIDDIKSMLAEIDEPAKSDEDKRNFSVIGTVQTRTAIQEDTEDCHDTIEYRKAFMNYCTKGTPIPQEFRDNATTTTSDAGAVIPTTYVNMIIQELESYGNIYEKVTKTNIPGGVEYPILSVKPVATWITADSGKSESDTQKISANDTVSFKYYGLECKISQTLLTSVVTIESFQNLFIPLASKAIARALDIAIMNGSGTGEALGITKDTRVPTANIITLSSDDIKSWEAWKKKVFGKMKKSYRKGIFFMAQTTFDGYIDGMADSVGQPIGRVNYGISEGESYRFGGKAVETVEDDVITAYDMANTGDVIAVFADLENYAINHSMNMQTVKWVDHDTNEIKNKVTMICDGKLLDANGVLIIKKGA